MDTEARAVHVELSSEIKLIQTDIKYIREAIQDIKKVIEDGDSKYASAKDLARLERIVYGGIGLILTGVILAGLGLVLK